MLTKDYPFFAIQGAEDVRRYHKRLADMMDPCKMKQDLIELKKKADYLCALMYIKEWRQRFGDEIEEMKRVCLEENVKLSEYASNVGKLKGWDTKFLPWGTSTYGPKYIDYGAASSSGSGPEE